MMCCDLYDLMYSEIVFEINDECMLKNLAIYFSVVFILFLHVKPMLGPTVGVPG